MLSPRPPHATLSPAPPHSPTQGSGTLRCPAGAGDGPVPAQPQGQPRCASATLPSPACCSQAPGTFSYRTLLQAGLGIEMEGGMLWGDRNPCSGKHIKGVTLYRGEEGGAGRGVTWCPHLGCLRHLSSLPPPSSGRPCSASAAFSGARISPPAAPGSPRPRSHLPRRSR